ncbi:conserved hypothetical protein [Leishmania mexicana MHOM/GT/2001/U1103]|uniref:Uncharacterized protein n=1 Tax=Leishmania mexicana (strain MHOM/GT/2001/U1103) TaxID=929439 RepID=E9ALN3_LEIMU|nr:conserved hypothetical protein [Leishmania mexicana MHOM/GT/2001/U1103]CBZ23838.1 conserved hypothetical protein [Leishmania mexicana MHOM/GT/2001/U1103]
MSPVAAQQFKSNALFRVLAFLDNTGAQAFALDAEVDETGNFRNPESVFAVDAAITGVLTAALDALRANVRRLFTDAAEQHALLTVLGTGAPEPSKKASLRITTTSAPLPPEEGGAAPADLSSDEALPQQESSSIPLSSAPVSTAWSEAALHPTSLAHYADDVENEIPIHLLVRLREVLSIPAAPLCCCSCSPFVEQLLIDGLDEWLRRCRVDEVKRMILACGVQPTVLNSTFMQKRASDAQDAALPDALADFVVDVVFPVPAQAGKASANASSTATAEALQDWLILSFEKNHEAVDIEDEEASASGQSDCSDNSGTNSQGERKRTRTDNTRPSSDDRDGLGAWEPTKGEEVLTAENIDRYLLECPQRIPKEILREKRKRISDASITEFELNHHYTAAELKKLVKEGLGTMTASEATDFMECPVTEAQVQQAARMTRKAQCVAWILSVHEAAA